MGQPVERKQVARDLGIGPPEFDAAPQSQGAIQPAQRFVVEALAPERRLTLNIRDHIQRAEPEREIQFVAGHEDPALGVSFEREHTVVIIRIGWRRGDPLNPEPGRTVAGPGERRVEQRFPQHEQVAPGQPLGVVVVIVQIGSHKARPRPVLLLLLEEQRSLVVEASVVVAFAVRFEIVPVAHKRQLRVEGHFIRQFPAIADAQPAAGFLLGLKGQSVETQVVEPLVVDKGRPPRTPVPPGVAQPLVPCPGPLGPNPRTAETEVIELQIPTGARNAVDAEQLVRVPGGVELPAKDAVVLHIDIPQWNVGVFGRGAQLWRIEQRHILDHKGRVDQGGPEGLFGLVLSGHRVVTGRVVAVPTLVAGLEEDLARLQGVPGLPEFTGGDRGGVRLEGVRSQLPQLPGQHPHLGGEAFDLALEFGVVEQGPLVADIVERLRRPQHVRPLPNDDVAFEIHLQRHLLRLLGRTAEVQRRDLVGPDHNLVGREVERVD